MSVDSKREVKCIFLGRPFGKKISFLESCSVALQWGQCTIVNNASERHRKTSCLQNMLLKNPTSQVCKYACPLTFLTIKS